jgi:hypothetical protein
MSNASYTHNCIEILQIIKYHDIMVLLDDTNHYRVASRAEPVKSGALCETPN